jgi:hypothetical protein
MTALIAIFLLLFIPGAMLTIHILRREAKSLWILAMLGALLAWPAVYLASRHIPEEIASFTWQPISLFSLSPVLLVDSTSWIFALVLATQLLAVMLTSVARFGEKSKPDQDNSPTDDKKESLPFSLPIASQSKSWQAWAGNLALTSLGLVAVLAGNLLTLLLAWAALDIVEMIILMGQVSTSELRGKVVITFSTRIAGMAVLLAAGIIIWSQGGLLEFNSISSQASLLLVLAAGLRLGILPIHVPFLQELPMRIGLGTILRLVPVSACLILLVRSAEVGIQGTIGLVMLGLTALAGLAGGVSWLRARDELAGRPYWILTTSSLSMAAAIQAQPTAALAWSLAAMLPGTLIFINSVKRRSLAPIIITGALCLTGLPFTPVWAGTSVFQPATVPSDIAGKIFTLLVGLILIAVHALLLAGYLIHGLRGNLIPNDIPRQQVERWVWLLYIPGLIILPILHGWLGWMIHPDARQATLMMWAEGPSALGLASAIWFFTSRPAHLARFTSPKNPLLSAEHISRPLYQLFLLLFLFFSQVVRVISTVLEGEAGILWALVLLVLVLVFLQQ